MNQRHQVYGTKVVGPATYDEWAEYRWRRLTLARDEKEPFTPEEYAGYTMSMWKWAGEDDTKLTDFYCRRVADALEACMNTTATRSMKEEGKDLREKACQLVVPDYLMCTVHNNSRSMVENDMIRMQQLLQIGMVYPHRRVDVTAEDLLHAFKEVYIDNPTRPEPGILPHVPAEYNQRLIAFRKQVGKQMRAMQNVMIQTQEDQQQLQQQQQPFSANDTNERNK